MSYDIRHHSDLRLLVAWTFLSTAQHLRLRTLEKTTTVLDLKNFKIRDLWDAAAAIY